jgi:L-serine dehydratase, iron-sulfur-dependent, beta subunit
MDVFDIVGPIMIGPSSSHTAGAVRIGRIARMLLGKEPVTAKILLHGSFAETYRGHGTDKALIAGIMGMIPDDVRIRNSLEIAEKKGIQYSFMPVSLENTHSNTAVIELSAEGGKKIKIQGSSVGGGNIIITSFNDMAVEFTNQHETLIVLHQDKPGVISEVTYCCAQEKINICSFKLSRMEKGGRAVMTIETDDEIPEKLRNDILEKEHVIHCTIINKTE